MSSIDFGSFTTTNGRTTGLGFASGLDSSSLIEEILAARQSNVTKNEDIIETNNNRIDAASQLKTLLSRFQSTADLLRAPTGINNASSDLFKYTTTSLSSSTSTAASTYLSVVSAAGASLTSYDITNVTKATAHQIQKAGFSSRTASVVGNSSVTDNYQTNLGTVSGSVLNASEPIKFSNDIVGSKAAIDVEFGSQNQFEALDEIEFGTTKITFGGAGGNDIDISSATTVADKVALIATRMNEITTGDEAGYTYTANGSTLVVTRDKYGSDSEIGTALAIKADFSNNADSTQTIKIGSDAALNNPIDAVLNVEGTDGSQASTATNAKLDMVFGSQNQFDATDSITFGNTTITFGGTGGDDINISSATTLNDKIDAIITRMNAVSTSPENSYTYSRTANGVLTITQNTTGAIADTGNDMTVTANFATGTTDTTQTVAFGKNYDNNGSSSGSVSPSNSSVSGSVSSNGIDGHAAASKATITATFLNNNFDAADGGADDTLSIGDTDITFGGSGDVAIGADLAETLANIADYMNSITTGPESGYTYTTNGVDGLVITRDVYGDNDTVTTNLNLDANFSADADTTNTVQFGSAAAANNPAATTLNVSGTDGVNNTSVSTAKTSHISTLSGDVTVSGATYIAGSSSATDFTPNSVVFTATVNGVAYTSKPVTLDGGSINGGGAGTSGIGDQIASGTEIIFVKDDDSNPAEGTTDVTFSLVVGDATTIADQTAAGNYATSLNTWLNTTNDITITQSPTVPEFRAGAFTLGGVELNLEEGDSLNAIKSKINSVSGTSGVTADIIQISDTNFSLVLKSKNTGVENKILEYGDGDSGDSPVGYLQIGLDNVSFSEVISAKDASFDIDGTTITRASNNINDVIDGLTFNIIADTPADTPPTLTVNVDSDNEIIKTGVVNFINAYNDLRFFISSQSERNDNNALVEDASLGDDSILRDILTQVDTQLTRSVSGLGSGAIKSLFAAGVDTLDFPGDDETPETKSVFTLDETKFDAAIASDFEALRNVFAFSFTSNSSELGVFKHSNKLNLTNFVLDIDNTQSKEFQVAIRDSTTNEILFYADLNESDSTIKGRAGTALEDTTFIYTGDGTDTITISATRGVADSVFNLVNNYTKDDGLVDQFVDSIVDDNDTIQNRIDDINELITSERERLIAEFSLLEAIISQANSTLSFLNSQLNASNK